MSYTAVVARITVRKHPNADRLLLGSILGNQVVVGLDTVDGELGVFFPADGQLSPEMCKANDLISRRELGTNKHIGGGFFCDNRRVRSQKFRKEKSDGWFCSLKLLEWTGYDISKLKDGDTFTELNGKAVCNKYYTQATLRARDSGLKSSRSVTKYFRRHIETAPFRFCVSKIPTGSIIYIDEKLHGTSGRYGHVIDPRKLGQIRKALNSVWYALKVKCLRADTVNFRPLFSPKEVFTYLNGSRNLILGETRRVDAADKFRNDLVINLTLRRGEVLYYEIVGYDSHGAPIMNAQPIKDQEVVKEYKTTHMLYKYGCPEGSCKMYVYRITHINDDGIEIELPRYQMEARCKELGLQITPRLCEPFVYDGNQDELRKKVEALTDGKSTIDPSHIREGVVVRIETPDGRTDFFKNKQFLFGILEGYIKEQDSYVDTEEVA